MEEQSPDILGGVQSVKAEEAENDNRTDLASPAAEEEDTEALPHSEILDIFEEGLAQLVQDPLLCDLPLQVRRIGLDDSKFTLSLYTVLTLLRNIRTTLFYLIFFLRKFLYINSNYFKVNNSTTNDTAEK